MWYIRSTGTRWSLTGSGGRKERDDLPPHNVNGWCVEVYQ